MRSAIFLLVYLLLSTGLEARRAPHHKTPSHKQESSHAIDWVASWRTCSGDGAIKRNGTLWQFGTVGGCNWGQIIPVDPKTGKVTQRKKYIYHLRGKRIGKGFVGARIINGHYRVYAIKRDGTLWGWGEGLGTKPRLLSHSRNWIDFRVKNAGNGCCAHDVGMQHDGSLWRFPEQVNYTHKNPIPYLKKIGIRKGWDRVILDCCSIYATRSDGTLWQNDSVHAKTRFKRIKYGIFCAKNLRLCQKLKHMPHRTLRSTESNDVIRINTSGRAGTLWMDPEVVYP